VRRAVGGDYAAAASRRRWWLEIKEGIVVVVAVYGGCGGLDVLFGYVPSVWPKGRWSRATCTGGRRRLVAAVVVFLLLFGMSQMPRYDPGKVREECLRWHAAASFFLLVVRPAGGGDDCR